MNTFVLVHGAWHGGWCWRRVYEQLTIQGHQVFTPTLTGLGERAHLLSRQINLDTHITDVISLLEAEELKNVILCGHSYAGCVITGVADGVSERIKALVYLDAFIPEHGKSQRELIPEDRRGAMDHVAKTKGEGWYIPPRNAKSFQVQSELDRDWVDRRCVAHPYATFSQPISLSGQWETVATKLYIRAANYNPTPFTPFSTRVKNDPTWLYEEIDAGHDVMIDNPTALVGALLRAANN